MWTWRHSGFIAFNRSGTGQFHFGCVEAELDWRENTARNQVDFSFPGFDEGDEVSGRGWVELDGDKMSGRILFHQGDESGFVARKGKA